MPLPARTTEAIRGILAPMARRPAQDEDREEERRLVARARSGDRAAFDRLTERHLPRVWGLAWRIVRNREDAEDLAQEVFLAAFRALPDFRGEARFSTWIHRIAVTRALNHLERGAEKVQRSARSLNAGAGDGGDGPTPAATLPSPAPSPYRALEAKERLRRLAECVRKLPAAWRAVWALREGEALPYEEIADVLRIALGTVRSRLARARIALKECVEGEMP